MLIYLQTIETEEDKNKFEDIYREYRGLWKFVKPIFIGDTIHVKLTVTDIRFSRTKRDRGVMNVLFEVMNQNDEICQSGTKVFMMKREVKE